MHTFLSSTLCCSRFQAVFWSTVSGMAEPAAALLFHYFAHDSLDEWGISVVLSVVAGIMISASIGELIPSGIHACGVKVTKDVNKRAWMIFLYLEEKYLLFCCFPAADLPFSLILLYLCVVGHYYLLRPWFDRKCLDICLASRRIILIRYFLLCELPGRIYQALFKLYLSRIRGNLIYLCFHKMYSCMSSLGDLV